MEKSGNYSSLGIEEDARDEELAKWEIGVLTSILIITLIGNILLLFALYVRKHRARRKMTRMYFFILHLSIADLLTGLLDVLPQLAWDITFRFQGGPLLCKIVKFFQPLGPYLSSYVLTATAIDRYHAICHPLNYCSVTSKRSRIMVYCAWIIAILLCIPQAFIFSYQEITPGVWDCWAHFDLPYSERAYVTWYSVTVFLLPLVVLVYTYTGICVGIWKSNKRSGIGDIKMGGKSADIPQQNRIPFISKAMSNTVKQTITVISLYIITSTPFIGSLLWAAWDPNASSSEFIQGDIQPTFLLHIPKNRAPRICDSPAFTILTLLSSLTSCVNPWIYLFFNRELREGLINYFWRKPDYSLTYGPPMDDKDVPRSNSYHTSARSSLISRVSR